MTGSEAQAHDVAALAEAYARALWISDTDTLRELFHARANLYGAGADGLEEYTLEEWLSIVANRPAASGEAQFAVRKVDCIAPDLAHVSLDASVSDRSFTDGLSLVKLDDEWKVVAKTFHIRSDSGGAS